MSLTTAPITVPLIKVGLPKPEVLMPALEKILYSGQLAEGESVYSFEKNFAEKFGLENVLAMSSGTAALHTALILAGVTTGDEVISTPMTAEPTNTSILQAGAKIIWADVDPLSGNIDPESIRKKITSKTKAIMVVHYAGYPVRLNEILKIATEFNIPLIEDCAHALGATYDGRPIGSLGDYAIFSFQAIKHMTTVDGGLLVVKDSSKMTKAKKTRWFGMLKGVARTEVDIENIGYKYNMNNVTATIGNCQLEVIAPILKAHIENGLFFDDAISRIKGLSFAKCDAYGKSSYWLYTLLTEDSAHVEKLLTDAGIGASKLHRPNSRHSVFKDSICNLPGLDAFYSKLLHLPCGWWVSPQDRIKIVEVLRKG